jgi:hypothetical protein
MPVRWRRSARESGKAANNPDQCYNSIVGKHHQAGAQRWKSMRDRPNG